MANIKAVRGTRDLLPPETALWNHVEATARAVFARYGFGEIRTPVFEVTELFARGVGEDTDIVSKEMYTWDDRGRAESDKGNSLTLRPENTAGVVRAYIEHKMADSGMLEKLFYIGPQFRRERPQRGRYRQFWQIGAEVLGPPWSGSDSPLRDAEVLEMLATLLNELGVKGWRLALNSVGSAEDRQRYSVALREALQPVKHKLCEDNQRRADTNPLRVLDSKDPGDQEIINGLPKISEFRGEDSRAHFEQVKAALDACGVPYVEDPRLVRGLDYYTRTTFEFTVSDGSGLGTQNALLGGGRYDGLSEMLGGPKAPGIGFAIGEDRLILTLQAQAKEAEQKKLDAFVAPMGVAQNPAALKLAQELRGAGLGVEVGDGNWRLKKSFEAADKLARKMIIVGEDEVASGQFTVKDFSKGEQAKIPREELAGALKS
jgi:histidyl-tRNA synthetase